MNVDHAGEIMRPRIRPFNIAVARGFWLGQDTIDVFTGHEHKRFRRRRILGGWVWSPRPPLQGVERRVCDLEADWLEQAWRRRRAERKAARR